MSEAQNPLGIYLKDRRTRLDPAAFGYTATRRPVTLVYSQWFERITDAIENERKLKKWTRAKKEAFIRGDFATLRKLAARRSSKSNPSEATHEHQSKIN